jgi:hypothetical protein
MTTTTRPDVPLPAGATYVDSIPSTGSHRLDWLLMLLIVIVLLVIFV